MDEVRFVIWKNGYDVYENDELIKRERDKPKSLINKIKNLINI